MSRSQVRELLDVAAAGSTITHAEIEALPVPPGLNGATFRTDVRRAVAECQRLAADGQYGDARRHAEATAGQWPNTPRRDVGRTDPDGLDPTQLAALIRR